MEEENGEDSEMLDAMEGWDSDQDDQNNPNAANANTGVGNINSSQAAEGKVLGATGQTHKINAA